jgi:hypothetical protein
MANILSAMGPDPEMKKQFNLAHELNNDLGIIMAQCDVLEEMLTSVPSATAGLEAIRKATRRMAGKIASSNWQENNPSRSDDKTTHRPSH